MYHFPEREVGVRGRREEEEEGLGEVGGGGEYVEGGRRMIGEVIF